MKKLDISHLINPIRQVSQEAAFEGNELLIRPPSLPIDDPVCFFLGTDRHHIVHYLPINQKLLSTHFLFLGSIGTGKTNALLSLTDQLIASMDHGDVMVIFDTKGDFYNEFYKPGHIVISNKKQIATGAAGKDYWNIFNEIDLDEGFEDNVREIASALFHSEIENSKQPFFPAAARDILYSIMLYHFRANQQRDNYSLRKNINELDSDGVRIILEQYPDLKSFTSYIAQSGSNSEETKLSAQSQGVLSELTQVINKIFIGMFKERGTLSIRQLVREKGAQVIFIEYDIAQGNVLTPIYSTIFDLALKEALSRRKSEGNVYLIADEFRLLPHLQHIENAANFGRSLGVKLLIGVQNVDQIYQAYGEHHGKSIMAGFSTNVSFRVNDHASREYIKNLYGHSRKGETFISVTPDKGRQEAIREAFVVEDWDVSNLAIGEAIIGFPGEKPFVFKFDPYQSRESRYPVNRR